MRRQPRPFVVEVKKKKRGDAARKPSIWGGLDLSAIAAEATERVPAIEPRHSEKKAIEPPAPENETVPPSTIASSEAQIDPDIDTRDVEHAPSEVADIDPAGAKRFRRRRGSAETLPRGQQWKRRLPEVLRRKK